MKLDKLNFVMQQLVDSFADAVTNRLLEKQLLQTVAPEADDPLVLDVHGVAKLLDCSIATVERHTRSGLIPSYKIGNLRRYNRDAVLLAVQQGEVS